jgi:putative hydrolase of the HAD superfamily
MVSLKKPDPRIYRLACENLGVTPEQVLYVGDGSSNELTGATVVGMHPVQIQDPGETADTHFVDKEQDWTGPVITSLSEVLDIVQ